MKILRNGKAIQPPPSGSATKRQPVISLENVEKKKTKLATTTIFDLTSKDKWVSASQTRNFALQDPILDWFEMYGEKFGYLKDEQDGTEFNFNKFIMEKGEQFENQVIASIRARFGDKVVTIGAGHGDSKSLAKFEQTVSAMKNGAPIIYQGVLHNNQNYTMGSPDLIVRSDYISALVHTSPIDEDEEHVGCDFSKDWHYRIVDVKYSTMRLYSTTDRIQNYSSTPAYKTQLAVYNEALGRAQGVVPPEAYILGRGWKYNSSVVKATCSSSDKAFDKLGRINYFDTDSVFVERAKLAVEWIRRLRVCGHRWNPVSKRHDTLPSVPELFPNMSNTEDFPFHYAKKKVAEAIDEITRVWNCGVKNRVFANKLGKYKLSETNVDTLGVTGEKTRDIISSILDRNNCRNDFIITQKMELSTDRISNDVNGWQTEEPNDLYVDFETVSNVNDDFSTFPTKGGVEMIWMIGCGYKNQTNGQWEFKNFVAKHLLPAEEYRIISEWINFMQQMSPRPRVFHWSVAEPQHLERARSEHKELKSLDIEWVDMHKIFITEPLTIKGAYDFKLKNVARAFKNWGYIQTSWDNSYVDGIGASVAAWKCDNLSRVTGKSLSEYDIIKEVEKYNEIDCKAVFEIVQFLQRYLD